MRLRTYLKHLAAGLGLTLIACTAAQGATPLRVGYWSSGVSLGFGALLEAQQSFQKAGFDVEFVRFPDVTGPNKAIAGNAIDLAFGAALAGAYNMAIEGVPIKIVLATQVMDAVFAVPADSPIQSVADLRGKKVGMSPVGSTTTAAATSMLQASYGIGPKDFSLVPGNESRLVQFVMQKDVDASVLRSLTVAQLGDDAKKLRIIGRFDREWKAMTKSDSLPYIGAAIVRDEWLAKYPDAAPRMIAAMRQTLDYGASHPDEVIGALKKAANMPDVGARFYADNWLAMNAVTFEPADLDTLKRTFDIFKAGGLVKGDLPDGLFVTGPYVKSKEAQ